MGDKRQRDGTIFYRESWPLQTASKDFNLTIGGELGSMEWLKMGQGKVLYFVQLFLHYNFLGKTLLVGKLKNLYIQYAWISIMKKQNSNKNV